MVTITGTNLAHATEVLFGGVRVTALTSDTATQIVFTSPAATAGRAGKVDIEVMTAGGTSPITSKDKFTYFSTPAVRRLDLTSGLADANLGIGLPAPLDGHGATAGATDEAILSLMDDLVRDRFARLLDD